MNRRMDKMAVLAVPTGIVLCVGLLFLPLVPARAEPYIAVRTGYKCSQCHVNQTGGGKRTDFGLLYAMTKLPLTVFRSPTGSSSFDGHLSQSVSVGANVRVVEHLAFEHTSSLGETVPSSNVTDFTEANLYFEVAVVPKVVTFYADQTLAPSSSNRELFGMLVDSRRHAYAKVGRMLLPYGLRIIDNDAFIRSKTGYNYSRSATGLELGWEPGPFAMVANLTDDDFSVAGSTVFRRFQVGAAFGRNTTRGNDSVVGAFGGVNFGRFTMLGEVDFITEGDVDQLATLAELNYLITQGFNFKFTYEVFDRNYDVSIERDGQERYTVGVEPFIMQFVQLKAFYRINRFIPQNAAQNQDQAVLEFHVFF
jgi:hypothetical protein